MRTAWLCWNMVNCQLVHYSSPDSVSPKPRTAGQTGDLKWQCCISCHFLPRCMQCRRGLAMRILSVCPSVCLSVTRVHCDKTVERCVQIYIPYERTFSLVCWEEKCLVGGNPFYLKFWINRPRWSKIADFQPIIARSASAVTPVWKLSETKLFGIRWPNYTYKNDWWEATPCTWNFQSKWLRWSEIWKSCYNSETVRDGMSVTINH